MEGQLGKLHLHRVVAAVAMGCTSCRDGHPPQECPAPKQQVLGTLWVTACQDTASGGSQRGCKPGSSPAPAQGRQLSIPNQGGILWLWGGHHPPPIRTLPPIPAGPQPCFNSKLEDKNSLGESKPVPEKFPANQSLQALLPSSHPSWGCQDPSHEFLVKPSPKTQQLTPAKSWLCQDTRAGNAGME